MANQRFPQNDGNDPQEAIRSFLDQNGGQLAFWGVLAWIIVTGKVGFLVDSFLFVIVLASLLPVIGFFVFRWWASNNVIETKCPSCGVEMDALKNQPTQCLNCSAVFTVNVQESSKKSPSASNDFKASEVIVDVDAKSVDP
eukprot:CAMPEP_0184681320 /NCGR_PEP_ID=MMETSP0312-20130426/4293_1 /TAXON_ID=31354 /ORGANISM="Compsopogon coeruleus, Strain SAG 36.94" /LENGTH=140 /DNA_ID=CAMNT_0027132079 /DNA_START=229 /DNA_END=651 /DNA_ORIENTATION=-